MTRSESWGLDIDEQLTERFPYNDPIELFGRDVSASRLVELLEPHLTDGRQRRIDQVLRGRTYNIATVFDGPYDRGNVSAVIRTAEGLGIQPFHVIETEEHFKEANRVTQGADKWIDVFSWEQPTRCITYLRDRGYRICASDLKASKPIQQIDLTGEPVALVFGNESDGVSEEVLTASDERFHIPMAGFVQSFNISVAAAISMYSAVERRGDGHGDMTPHERQVLKAHYYLRSVSQPDKLVPALLERRKSAE